MLGRALSVGVTPGGGSVGPSRIRQARRTDHGSQIGGIPETQKMMDYSMANGIYPQVEVTPIERLDEAYREVLAGEVKFCYAVDMSTLN